MVWHGLDMDIDMVCCMQTLEPGMWLPMRGQDTLSIVLIARWAEAEIY